MSSLLHGCWRTDSRAITKIFNECQPLSSTHTCTDKGAQIQTHIHKCKQAHRLTQVLVDMCVYAYMCLYVHV